MTDAQIQEVLGLVAEALIDNVEPIPGNEVGLQIRTPRGRVVRVEVVRGRDARRIRVSSRKRFTTNIGTRWVDRDTLKFRDHTVVEISARVLRAVARVA